MTTRFPGPFQNYPSGRSNSSLHLPLPSTVPVSASSSTHGTLNGHSYANRLSRRSFSKHPNRTTTLDTLRRTLKPEWEVDYLGTTLDDNVPVNNSTTSIDRGNTKETTEPEMTEKIVDQVGERLNSLQELRYLASLDNSMLELPIEDTLTKLQNYQTILTNSRVFLKPLFDYLLQFESDLNTLSLEMEFLQKRSHNLNYLIEDKSQIEEKLTPIINDLIIPPEIIKSLVVDPIEERWIENLRFISEKREIYTKYKQRKKGLSCLADLQKLLDYMELKAIERIRDFIIMQIRNLRRGGVSDVSSQVVQKKMLDVKEAYNFLLEAKPKLASELRQAYCHTMRWYYYQHFVKYLSSLEKLSLTKVGGNVLLGSADDEATNAKSFFGSSKKTKSVHDEITLNEYIIGLPKRLEILSKVDETVMPAQIAENNKLKYHLESHFKNFNQTVMDNVSTEYLFLNDFFKITSFETMNELSKLIFNPVYQLGQNYTKYLITDSYDLFGILIIIRLVQSMEYELQHRRVPILEDYMNYQLILLWPKFQTLIDENCQCIKRTISSTSILKQISKNVMVPLSLTQNFGMVMLNLLKLSTNLVFELETSEPLNTSISRLSSEFESAILKLGGNNKKKELFYYNNFYLVWSILSSGDFNVDGVGKLQTEHYKQLCDVYTS
ncbi:unnamed protein product [Ambrosiozyma monospora]|uniref:Unnamed protein product n=1 Tax=Ambrosiozyma monospora TaxID=43982 RepID=A0ACB5SV74_AMBMO|nr:unnamed protein product [Ambrosiozyma monospora]